MNATDNTPYMPRSDFLCAVLIALYASGTVTASLVLGNMSLITTNTMMAMPLILWTAAGIFYSVMRFYSGFIAGDDR